MRIERIELDGFGRFHEERWELDEGLTVLVGANEAGKTTLLNALRAILFGFEPSRDGRAWYPALAGGRRGGRLVLRAADGARWVVERHGERGGAGSLAVRAPNGNQGGQETLDRLLHGADRDLFNNIFAFGLGELQTFSSLSADGVRGRIYGARAGLGGTSALDLERRLRQQLDAIHLPRGQRPLNQLLSRLDDLRAEIAELERQPEQYEAAHRERAELGERSVALREAIHRRRERAARLARLRSAAPVAAELALVEAELAEGDATLDDVAPDAVARLDRHVAELREARATLAAIDEELGTARREREEISVDRRLLAAADEIRAVGEERALRAGAAARRTELRAAESRHAAAVAEQLARAGGWDEKRLLALDDSIPAVEATREHERAIAASRAALADAEQRHRTAAEELARRESEAGAAGPEGGDDARLEERAAALRRLDQLRVERAAAEARAAPAAGARFAPSTPAAFGAAVGIALIGLVAGALTGAPLPGLLIGLVVGATVVGVGFLASRASTDGGGRGLAAIDAERAELLLAAELPADATDTALAVAADELAGLRARRTLLADQRASLETRRAEVERRAEESREAAAALERALAAWRTWLAAHGIDGEPSPEAARQLMAAAGIARGAAGERDEQRRRLAELDRDDAAFVARLDALAAALGLERVVDPARRDAVVVDLLDRLERARMAERRAAELDATLRRQEGRRTGAATSADERLAALDGYLRSAGCPDADAVRRRAAAADERRAARTRARELRERLAGIAGSVEAIGPLVEELRTVDPVGVEAEEAEIAAELTRLEDEERATLNQIGALDARIRQLEAADELGMRRQERVALEGRASRLAREWAVRALALRLLEETRSRYERERQPDVVRAAESHFARITDGRYARIIAPPGDASVRVETDGGESKGTEELSRGTAEQLYLALRFGLIEEFARHAEPMPVVMDDILVNFDAGRAERAAAAIGELARRHQVLYFTCHRWTAELLERSGARVLELEAAATIG